MNLERLDITQMFTKLSWDVQRPTYTFEPAKTDVQIEKSPAEVIIKRTQPRLIIDQSQCWADMNCKHIFQRVRDEAEDGKQAFFTYLSTVTTEGRRIGAIENKENPIKNLAREKSLAPKYQFTYGNVPKNFSLKFEIIPGETHVDWTESKMKVDFPSHPYHHQYEQGRLSYYIQKQNQLHIQVIGGTIDRVQ
ncbi:hypothetical protein DFP93_10860 [Aneurinibacillus soli]|uniref:Uncharacterized protein n=1 Tax=Aneurinibacillus soli TaxID=1500254 RepID=A0A0U5BEI5_9BACL|nr:DUF6470 family protein [Aneurinibacillus soli]PYE61487.1 hypothetical protein DFP93_10860 [Aneurinibacillus soli]BAU26558.1 hypothetical protein CB4_00685 [Aneurinibacillus soli]